MAAELPCGGAHTPTKSFPLPFLKLTIIWFLKFKYIPSNLVTHHLRHTCFSCLWRQRMLWLKKEKKEKKKRLHFTRHCLLGKKSKILGAVYGISHSCGCSEKYFLSSGFYRWMQYVVENQDRTFPGKTEQTLLLTMLLASSSLSLLLPTLMSMLFPSSILMNVGPFDP